MMLTVEDIKNYLKGEIEAHKHLVEIQTRALDRTKYQKIQDFAQELLDWIEEQEQKQND